MESVGWNKEMGYAGNRGPLGIYYLATRAETPFCGIEIYEQLNLLIKSDIRSFPLMHESFKRFSLKVSKMPK